MSIFKKAGEQIKKLISYFLHASIKKKLAVSVLFIGIVGAGFFIYSKTKKESVRYQTEKAAKGTLITSISGTGTISSGNSTNITTAATGTITKVYVTNGEVVKKGDKIAELELDDYGVEQQATAWSNYIDTLNAVKTAEKQKDDYDIQMWEARQDILDAEDSIETKELSPINPETGKEWTLSERTVVDKSLDKARKAYAEAEGKYKNADAAIAKAKAKVTAAYRDYQEVSSTLTAPIDGTVNNLSLAQGVIITSSSTSKTATSTTSDSSDTSNTITSQKIGKIYSSDGQLQATVNLTESDIVNVAPNQKVTLALDAYSDKSFTGKVLAVDTSGSVSSGVTTYPVTILLDKTEVSIYPNMAVSATIIISVKSDVLLISAGSVATSGEISTVQVLKNNVANTVTVTTGETDGSQIEILSGLSEGDIVITNSVSANSQSENNTTSLFGTTKSSNNRSTNSGGGMPAGGMGGGPPGM